MEKSSSHNGEAQSLRSPAKARVRISIENVSTLPDVYVVSSERFEEAIRRHRGLEEHIEVRIASDYDDFERRLQQTEVLVTSLMGSNAPPLRLLAQAPRLRWIQYIGAGIDHLLPLDWLRPGVVLTKSLGAHLPNAAEYAATALLMLNNHIPRYAFNQRRHHWERVFPTSIRGKTLAIVGVGCIGGAVAAQAKALGLKVLGIRRSGEPHEHVDEMFGPSQLQAVLPRADFVFVCPALTPATRGMIGRREFELMKPEAGFVSIARGPVIDLEALADRLRQGCLGGAVINAFDAEPLPTSSFLWDTPNLIITPHIGTQDREKYADNVLEVFLTNLQRYLAGKPLLFQASRALGY